MAFELFATVKTHKCVNFLQFWAILALPKSSVDWGESGSLLLMRFGWVCDSTACKLLSEVRESPVAYYGLVF